MPPELAFHVSVAVCDDAKPPVPANVTTGLPVVALVEKVTEPADVPAAPAINEIVKACDPLTAIVAGKAVESTLNPAPAGVAPFTVSGWLPVLYTTTVAV